MDNFYEERNVYEQHMAKNVYFEKEARESEKDDTKTYREQLIKSILEWTQGQYTAELLKSKSTKTLEIIHDNC